MGMPSGMPRRPSGLIAKWCSQRCRRMQALYNSRRMKCSRIRASRRKRRVGTTCSSSPCCQAAAQ
eukprot:3203707-Amphidinium_carterae.1